MLTLTTEQKRQTRRRPRKLIPAISVSLTAFLMFGRNALPGGTLQKLASQIESPYETEWNSLKKIVKSTAEHLKAQLDLKIEPDKLQ